MKNPPRKPRKPPDHSNDFDSPWKTLLERYFQEVLDLYEFIDWLLDLPEVLDRAFTDEIHELEESTNMRYISNAERMAMKREREEGLQQGIALMLRQLRQRRFGTPPDWVETKLQEGTAPQLEQWFNQLLDADNLETVFKG